MINFLKPEVCELWVTTTKLTHLSILYKISLVQECILHFLPRMMTAMIRLWFNHLWCCGLVLVCWQRSNQDWRWKPWVITSGSLEETSKKIINLFLGKTTPGLSLMNIKKIKRIYWTLEILSILISQLPMLRFNWRICLRNTLII